MSARRLAWDSDFFGIDVAEFDADPPYSNPVDFQGFDLVYVKSAEENVVDAPGYFCSFAEQRRVYMKSLESCQSVLHSDIKDGLSSHNQIQALRQLAYESGKYSRFKLDTRFGESAFFALYDRWVEKSLDLSFADKLFFYELEGELCGFVTLRIAETSASVGLIAVDSSFQGMGIGSKLLAHSENWLSRTGVRKLHIPTQSANVPACQFYEAKGYALSEKSFIRHFWKS